MKDNLGAQKLRLWSVGKSLRGAARELGVDYHTYVRWRSGTLPEWQGRRTCKSVADIDYDTWELPPAAKLERKIVHAKKAAESE